MFFLEKRRASRFVNDKYKYYGNVPGHYQNQIIIKITIKQHIYKKLLDWLI